MENAEALRIYDPHVPRQKSPNETKPTSVRMTPATEADYAEIQRHHRVTMAAAVAIAGAAEARRIRAEAPAPAPAPKRKR